MSFFLSLTSTTHGKTYSACYTDRDAQRAPETEFSDEHLLLAECLHGKGILLGERLDDLSVVVLLYCVIGGHSERNQKMWDGGGVRSSRKLLQISHWLMG